MRITPLPSEERYIPPAYRDMQDPPVVVYRPLTARDKARWFSRLVMSEAVPGSADDAPVRVAGDKQAEVFCDLFIERVVRIENLFIGDRPYTHDMFDHLDGEFVFTVAGHIWQRSGLTDDDLGKSSSSSS